MRPRSLARKLIDHPSQDQEVVLHRAAKEALLEAGQTFGLVHCADRSRAMALSKRIQEIDQERLAFALRARASCFGE